jgi:hypothetical protein
MSQQDTTFTKNNLSIHQLMQCDFQSEIATLRLFIKHLPEMQIENEEMIPTMGECRPFNSPEKNLKWLTFRAEQIIDQLERLHEQSAKIEHAVRLVEAGIKPGHTIEISGGK